MSVQIEDDTYAQLLKDANDNNAIIKVAKMVLATIIALILLVTIVIPSVNAYINISIDKARIEMEHVMAIEEAKINAQVREIESVGMSNEEYIQWIKVR